MGKVYVINEWKMYFELGSSKVEATVKEQVLFKL